MLSKRVIGTALAIDPSKLIDESIAVAALLNG
jgi:hypothetical protein